MAISMPRCCTGLLFPIVLLSFGLALSGCGADGEPISAAPSPESAGLIDPSPASVQQPEQNQGTSQISPTNVPPDVPASAANTGTPIPNQAPQIAGIPQTSIDTGRAYSFLPSASDADHDRLRFSIENKPVWTAFDTATGKLTGNPVASHIGTTAGIVISVTDGQDTASLAPFSIMVNRASTATATLTWEAPTKYEDGTPLVEFDGYRIYYWKDHSPTQVVEISNASVSIFVFDDLPPAKWYFRLTAVADGVESKPSVTGSKTIS